MINQRGRDDIVYWRCTRSRNSHCIGTVTTGPGDTIVSVKNTHNHPPDQVAIEAKKIVSSLKEAVQTRIQPVPAVYQEEVIKVAATPRSEEVAAQLPTLASIKSSLYRRRRKLLPQLPTSRSDVNFEGEWSMTLKGEQFLLAEDGPGESKIVNLRYSLQPPEAG